MSYQRYRCYVLFQKDMAGATAPVDCEGCILEAGHIEPHEFLDENKEVWCWHDDPDCNCENCQDPDEDSCFIYWKK